MWSIVVTPGLMVGGSDSKHYGKAAKIHIDSTHFHFNSELDGLHGINEKINKEILLMAYDHI